MDVAVNATPVLPAQPHEDTCSVPEAERHVVGDIAGIIQ